MNTISGRLHNSWLKLAIVGVFVVSGLILVGQGWAASRVPEQSIQTSCNTIITSNINGDTTWTEANGPYCIHARVQVVAPYTLTIQPGVGVYFGDKNTALDVLGTLIAEGTEAKGIRFTSESDAPTPGLWGRLYVPVGGHASLAYCEISYGGSDEDANGAGLRTDTSNVTVSHCNIHHNNGIGIRIFGGAASPTITDSTIDSNTGAGIYIRGDFNTFHNQPLLQNLTIQNNGGAAIYLASGESGNYTAFPNFQNLTFSDNGSDALNMQGTGLLFNLTMDSLAWFNGKPILVVSYSLEPRQGYTLTLAPGTTLQFATPSGHLLAVNGSTIVAEGTADHPIILSSAPARMQPGAWQGVKAYVGGHLQLAYCDLSYAGSDGMGLLIEANDVQVHNCRIHDNLGDGVYQWGDYSPVLEDTQIDHNTGAAIRELPNGNQYNVPTYHNLTFTDNGSDALNLGFINLQVDRTLDGPGSFNGAPIILLGGIQVYSEQNALTVTPGTTIQFDVPQGYIDGKLIAQGTAALPITFTSDKAVPRPGDWSALVTRMGSRLSFCKVEYGGGDYRDAVSIYDIDVKVRDCLIRDSLRGGLSYSYYNWGYYGPETARYENLALTDNLGAGLQVGQGSSISNATAANLTLARNGMSGVNVAAGGTVVLTNTLVANNAVGAYVEGNLVMATTLWDSNDANYQEVGDGNFNETGAIEGPSNFKADGYHILCTSAAINQGMNIIPDDIDGEPRPWPVGTQPDLGADESPCGQIVPFAADKVAFPPQWIFDPVTGSGLFRQQYLMGYYFSGVVSLPVTIVDTLPTGLDFVSQNTFPTLSFGQLGQVLTWHSLANVSPGTMGIVNIDSNTTSLSPGVVLNNVATVDAGSHHADLQVSTTLPLVAPLLASPGDGETCKGRFPITGTAQPGSTVQILVNSAPYDEVIPDPSGTFTGTIDYPSTGEWSVTTRACVNTVCSPDSNAMVLTPQQSFWCPRQSVWKSPNSPVYTRQFRDDKGWFTTNHPVFSMNKYAYLYDHTLTVATGSFPLLNGNQITIVTPPEKLEVEINGVYYLPDEQTFPPNFDYITYSFYVKLPPNTSLVNACIHAWYGGVEYVSCITLHLIDPDGTVFDITQGFDPDNPTATAIEGITVTCMVSESEWGGWVPWPAQFYNDQVNPQVTGADGYFAFFTPPGLYYLQVDGKPGYESWRSPVIEVSNQVVHVNVPLTPFPVGTVHQVTLMPFGMLPPTIKIPVGDSVEWFSTLSGGDVEGLLQYTRNPVLRPLSDLDPQSNILGWDGGMLVPGQTYRRQFNQAGNYSYSDGAGHTGTVIVLPCIFLPLVGR
jgi:plastocyanin